MTTLGTAAAGEQLAIFDTALLGVLGFIGLWLLVRHPRTVIAVAVGLVVWFEAGPNAPLWPWALAAGLAVLALLRALGRLLLWGRPG